MAETWTEQMAQDESLRTFVEAEINRAHVTLEALRFENHRLMAMVGKLSDELKALKKRKRIEE